ncbi:MAG: peptide-methionine (S)-S-oxide reductase MsrA [Thermoanaerobaculia bacterium]|nr:peptide-methionine (S)-S-oxide reductase MsrA [Thermoanaerobaculia bacterium]
MIRRSKIRALSFLVTLSALLACSSGTAQAPEGEGEGSSEPRDVTAVDDSLESAVFAGGCFWCMEPPYDRLEGVVSTTSGYAGGEEHDPTYEEVSSGATGHAEVVRVVYDPEEISYEELLEVFWHNIDPTVEDRQFCDHGSQYRTAIFYQGEDQRRASEASKRELERTKPFEGPIVTEIEPLEAFYPAEEYHQDFYRKNPVRYKTYRMGCGRDARLEELWGEQAGGY